MKEYVFLLKAPAAPLDEQQATRLRQGWGKLVTQLRQAGQFIEGYIFSTAGYCLEGFPEPISRAETEICAGKIATGCLMILVPGLPEALAIARLCPILDFGGAVEVRERMPQPAQQPVA